MFLQREVPVDVVISIAFAIQSEEGAVVVLTGLGIKT
jgi:hypothetical protein